ncbi:MAG: serine/threonine-protein kinase [Actinomycetaceae bacterium]|nr:serine/threonine protein kinase [Arcanobacterium sp.]MDD7505507.1 serine/threonine-protein kinase [Actinomycetaceae bacterium]MDY6143488.1 serine/threonine-protein kinase [Arcanobacterium sp.]
MREAAEIGGYRIIKQIGYGGMSTVYEAEDGAGLRVALKLLHPALAADDEARRRIQREVAVLRRVRGPYVAEILDAETEGDEIFVVTELVDGPTLERDVEITGMYTEGDLLELGQGLAHALEAIHRVGVLHRDIKPSNVMISGGKPILIDFGISQLADDTRITRQGYLAHTPGYLDPRVIRGEDPDAAGDWWALAAVLAFAATGLAPFGTGNIAAVTARVMNNTPQLDDLGDPLRGAFTRALHPDLHQRLSYEELLGVIEHPERYASADYAPTLLYGRQANEEQGVAGIDGVDGSLPTLMLGTAQQVPLAATQVVSQPYDVPAVAPHVMPPAYPTPGMETQVLPEPRQVPQLAYPSGSFDEPAIRMPETSPEMESLPQWAQPPQTIRLLLILSWVFMSLASYTYPLVMTQLFFGVIWLCDVIGSVQEYKVRRRLGHGGSRSRETGAVMARIIPFAAMGLLRMAFAAVVGHFIGYVVGWAFATQGIAAAVLPGGGDSSLAYAGSVVAGVGATYAVAWLWPSARKARLGARYVMREASPSRGYYILWLGIMCAFVLIALWYFHLGNAVSWFPLTTPLWQ